MGISLNLHQLREEIDFLRHTWRLKKTAPTLESCQDAARSAQADPGPCGSEVPRSEGVGLLLEWVNAVCAFYRKKVSAAACVSAPGPPWPLAEVTGRQCADPALHVLGDGVPCRAGCPPGERGRWPRRGTCRVHGGRFRCR